MSKIYKLFKINPKMFILKKLRIQGEYDPILETINIDYRKEIFATVCHESLHHFYPNWTESQITRTEYKIMNSMSIRQIKNFIKRFSNIL